MRRPLLLACIVIAGCDRSDPPATVQSERKPPPAAASDPATPPIPDVPQVDAREGPHHVVFGDRAEQAYVLLLPPAAKRPAPTRDELAELVRRELDPREPEVAELEKFVRSEPLPAVLQEVPDSATAEKLRHEDLLGLRISARPIAEVVAADHLTDAVLTRVLDESQRASVGRRRQAWVISAQYRNIAGVRGYRLLQTLVRLVAREHDALIYDADTFETIDADELDARRLRTADGNIADQIVVVPFADRRHAGKVRLATRGMRRFASVDLELDGLSAEPGRLQAATHLLQGLAYRMVRDGQYDGRGYATEAAPAISITLADVRQAYAGRGSQVPACRTCPQEVEVHLVERPPEPHDPPDHVVARVVAPREVSDAPDYDQVAWTETALAELLGPA